MTGTKGILPILCLIVLSTAVASGPLVSGVDLTSETDPAPATGHATITDVTLPEQATLSTSPKNDSYTIRVPNATARIDNVSGQPLLIYKIRILSLSYVRGTTHFVDESWSGKNRIPLREGTFTHSGMVDSRHQAVVSLVIRDDRGERVLKSRRVPVVRE